MGRAPKRAKAARKGDAAPAQDKDDAQQQQYVQDPIKALLAVHPSAPVLAVAVGPHIRVHDGRTKQTNTLTGQDEVVRALAFDHQGRYLLSGGDDKRLTLWDATTWQPVLSVALIKKLTAVASSPNSQLAFAADKFGDVHCVLAEPGADGSVSTPELLLGHYSSILTCVAAACDGRRVATGDADHRLRVTALHGGPLPRVAELESCCLGHTQFVTCCAFVGDGREGELLVSGSGDGTLRLWDPPSGKLLSTLELPAGPAQPAAGKPDGKAMAGEPADDSTQEGHQHAAGGEEPVLPVVALAASPSGQWLAAAVEGSHAICLARLRPEGPGLELVGAGWYDLPGLKLPTSLCFDASNRLWAVGGPPAGLGTAAFVACAHVDAQGLRADDGALDPEARAALEGLPAVQREAAASAACAAPGSLTAHLRKREYRSEEQAEWDSRKRNRNDYKAKAAQEVARRVQA